MTASQSPRTVGEAIEQAKQEREAAPSPDIRKRIVTEQIADTLIGIRWAVGGLLTEL
jgi:hypothetical protein